MQTITYRTHTSAWSSDSPYFTPDIEHTLLGRMGYPDAIGHVPIHIGHKLVARPHWTDIKNYFPEKPGYF